MGKKTGLGNFTIGVNDEETNTYLLYRKNYVQARDTVARAAEARGIDDKKLTEFNDKTDDFIYCTDIFFIKNQKSGCCLGGTSNLSNILKEATLEMQDAYEKIQELNQKDIAKINVILEAQMKKGERLMSGAFTHAHHYISNKTNLYSEVRRGEKDESPFAKY